MLSAFQFAIPHKKTSTRNEWRFFFINPKFYSTINLVAKVLLPACAFRI